MRNLILILTLTLALALPAFAEPSVLRQNGDCKLVRAGFNDPGVVKVSLKNEDVTILCKFREDDFFGRNVIMANPEITNLSDKELSVAYHVAFFSQNGDLIGSATQEGTIKPTAKAHQFGSCIITVPTTEVAKVSSYKVSVYVQTPKPKK